MAAKAAGVQHIIRWSIVGADQKSRRSLPRHQGRIDDLVLDCGSATTIRRPNMLMQNFTDRFRDMIDHGALYLLHGEGAASLIDADDVARASVQTLLDATSHQSQIIP